MRHFFFNSFFVILNFFYRRGVGHFSQLVHGRAAKIGCAITQWWDKALKTCSMYFVCNFNEGNMRSYSVYDSGRAASGCNNGPHPIFKYLCNVNERYDDFKKCVQAKKHWTGEFQIDLKICFHSFISNKLFS